MKNRQAERKHYEEPRISIIRLEMENVIVTSGESEEDSSDIVTPPVKI